MSDSKQSFNETFKTEAIKYVQEQTKTLPEIAEELNIAPGTLRQWVGKYREFEHEPVNHGTRCASNLRLSTTNSGN